MTVAPELTALKAKARDKIKMLEGKKPYNNMSNVCWADPYFAQSIVRDFGPAAGSTDIQKIKKWAKT